MSTKQLLAPELRTIDEVFPAADITPANLAKLREISAASVVLGDPAAAGVTRSEVWIDSIDPPLRALLYAPVDGADDRPGYLHIHGGGYIIGAPEGSDASNLDLCARLGVVVLSVDYRLAPEHPVPAPLDDCHAGLAWLHENAARLRVDPRRIAIGGESAGGGLAAALAIRVRDEGRYPVCHQHLTYPMLDDRTGSDAQPGDPLTGEFVWTRQRNAFGWGALLGDTPPAAPWVPARVDQVAGLPPTWMFTAALDLFRDENIDYAQRLLRAGVPVEFLMYAGACHGFQMIPGSPMTRRFREDHLAALGRGLGVDAGVR